jgi:hypothetical protein
MIQCVEQTRTSDIRTTTGVVLMAKGQRAAFVVICSLGRMDNHGVMAPR